MLGKPQRPAPGTAREALHRYVPSEKREPPRAPPSIVDGSRFAAGTYLCRASLDESNDVCGLAAETRGCEASQTTSARAAHPPVAVRCRQPRPRPRAHGGAAPGDTTHERVAAEIV